MEIFPVLLVAFFVGSRIEKTKRPIKDGWGDFLGGLFASVAWMYQVVLSMSGLEFSWKPEAAWIAVCMTMPIYSIIVFFSVRIFRARRRW